MGKITRNFIKGRMEKTTDERLIPQGTYIDALNIRLGSTEDAEVGVISNSKGNEQLTTLRYIDGTPLSDQARTIGKFADSVNETLYWFVHDPNFSVGATGKLDMIVSYNVFTNILTYHIISIDDGDGINTTLNFNPQYLIIGIDLVIQTSPAGQSGLVYFTDKYNAPRFFNKTRNYENPVGNIDDSLLEEAILVIKKPPTESPVINTFLTGGQENFIDTRFICFAYRYRYEDNEYSATSQWSEPAFTPNPFNFSVDSYLNEGMTNGHNTVQITFNTGGALVKAIDLLFKEAGTATIKVIEKLNKIEQAYSDNTDIVYMFNNSKIFTVLPEYEILRLYDNVPRFAKAQTIMGNRLVYGNYIEGYNMIDSYGQPVKLGYAADLVEDEIGESILADTTSTGNYNINGAETVPNSVLNIDFSGLTFPLPAGGSVSIDITIEHQQFSYNPSMSPVTDVDASITVSLSFFLINEYTSLAQMVASVEFQERVGIATNIQTDPADYCNGATWTDYINCYLPSTVGVYLKFASGISADGQPIAVTVSGNTMKIQFVAMRYVNSITAPTQNVYEFYKVSTAQAIYQEIANPRSLHSNRGYEVGIVYMDEFNRSTTALVSTSNNVHVPCGNSALKNSIQVTIPYDNIAPAWATRYKFVIKADQENYETVYTSIYFDDPDTNSVYFLLEGENAQKVEVGDRLIVKADSSGPVQNCAYATVLEKEVKKSGFINPDGNFTVPAGVYMKINPNSFAAVNTDTDVIAPGQRYESQRNENQCPVVYYPVNIETSPGVYDYNIPAGSKIHLFFRFERNGTSIGSACEERKYTYDRVFVSPQTYDGFMEWWDGENIASTLNTGTGNVINYFIPGLYPYTNLLDCNLDGHFQFQEYVPSGQIYLAVNGVRSCGNTVNKASRIWVNIEVFRAENMLIFETEPSNALPDVFFENDLSFAIIDGDHQGNVQDQSFYTSTPAIIDTGFYNCFCFGNGAESYKIRDSVSGQTFNFGNRVTSVSAQDYKEANRFADLTYSGVYNDESNINKLNEFNLGLVNYKPLESSFGPIQIIDGRETDIRVLQEDKVSYVLAGKNLLSDAAAGGAITSIPEILGTQIARIEKFGISSSPESYTVWGYDTFFTDAKRGAVLQLRGSSYNEALTVISEFGMRTWFRDMFITDFNTQKLGGYDPYMNEYVLTTNDISLPVEEQCIACGMSQTFNVYGYEDIDYCVDVGQAVGETVISWIVTPTGTPFEVIVSYNGTDTSSGSVSDDGLVIINKDLQFVETLTITIISTGDIRLEVTAGCPVQVELMMIQVGVTNDSDAGDFVHNQYNYIDGTYISPTTSTLVAFASGTDNPLVSQYTQTNGYVGTGNVPTVGSIVRMICNNFDFDTYNFDTSKDRFLYLRSNTLYANTPTDIAALLAVANVATPNQGGGTNNYAEFTMPGGGSYMYLIWDYRTSLGVPLCYSVSSVEACCECEACLTECNEYFISSGAGTVSYKDCYTGEILSLTVAAYQGYFLCSDSDYIPFFETGGGTIQTISACGCDNFVGECWYFEIVITETAEIDYTPCGGSPILNTFTPGVYFFCVSVIPIINSGIVTMRFDVNGCP